MKHTFLTGFFLGICLLCSVGFLGAGEVEFYGGVNFLTFDPNMDNAYSNPLNHPNYSGLNFPYLYIFGGLKIKNEITENVTFDLNIIRDNIYKNNLEILLGGRSDYFSFQVGPFIGAYMELSNFEMLNKPFYGVLGNITLMYPGTVFLEFYGSISINNMLEKLEFGGDFTRESIGGRLGFWLPNAIPSFGIHYKGFTDNENNANFSLEDSLTRYQLSIDFFSKNYPFVFRLDSGYQTLARSFIYNNPNTPDPADTYSMFFAGFEFKVQMTNTMKFLIGAEIPVITDKKNTNISNKIPAIYLMPVATAGFIISSD